MVVFIAFVLSALLFAVVLYYAIKLIDPENTKNNFKLALIIAAIYSIFGSIGGLFLGIIPLVALVLFLMNYYELETREIIIVIVTLIISNLIVSRILESVLL